MRNQQCVWKQIMDLRRNRRLFCIASIVFAQGIGKLSRITEEPADPTERVLAKQTHELSGACAYTSQYWIMSITRMQLSCQIEIRTWKKCSITSCSQGRISSLKLPEHQRQTVWQNTFKSLLPHVVIHTHKHKCNTNPWFIISTVDPNTQDPHEPS